MSKFELMKKDSYGGIKALRRHTSSSGVSMPGQLDWLDTSVADVYVCTGGRVEV